MLHSHLQSIEGSSAHPQGLLGLLRGWALKCVGSRVDHPGDAYAPRDPGIDAKRRRDRGSSPQPGRACTVRAGRGDTGDEAVPDNAGLMPPSAQAVFRPSQSGGIPWSETVPASVAPGL